MEVKCDYCGKVFDKQYKLRKHNFCCRDHFYKWNSARISQYNKTENPMNKVGGVLQSRLKRGAIQRGKGSGKSYIKFLGRHEHRLVAEQMLGRKLGRYEYVHHINCNKKDNRPENLRVLSPAEHASLHAKLKRGDV